MYLVWSGLVWYSVVPARFQPFRAGPDFTLKMFKNDKKRRKFFWGTFFRHNQQVKRHRFLNHLSEQRAVLGLHYKKRNCIQFASQLFFSHVIKKSLSDCEKNQFFAHVTHFFTKSIFHM